MIRLENTNGSDIASAISAERHKQGSSTTGMVLTLLILADEEFQADATTAAINAAREHPMRIITVIPKPSGRSTSLDAEISVGGDDGPGEVAVLRLRGELAEHADSVVIPLLLADTPVVSFWPGLFPDNHGTTMIGNHSLRRITDSAAAPDPINFLRERSKMYKDGDTDLAWTRITTWRSALAAALDQPLGEVTGISVVADPTSPSAFLLAQWLHSRLNVEASVIGADIEGIDSVTLHTPEGPLEIKRTDDRNAVITRPHGVSAKISLPRRQLDTLLAEELRQLSPDEIYARVLRSME